MIIGIGSDLIDIRRVAKVIERHGDRFLDRISKIRSSGWIVSRNVRANLIDLTERGVGVSNLHARR